MRVHTSAESVTLATFCSPHRISGNKANFPHMCPNLPIMLCMTFSPLSTLLQTPHILHNNVHTCLPRTVCASVMHVHFTLHSHVFIMQKMCNCALLWQPSKLCNFQVCTSIHGLCFALTSRPAKTCLCGCEQPLSCLNFASFFCRSQ